MALEAIAHVRGRGVVVPGDDIDTDRIIPARYMKVVTFDGLGEFLFRDVRRGGDGRPLGHPLDARERRGATVLVSGRNFGCGSSREHAPQAVVRAGFRAVIAGSFAEIFFGNATMLGIPCLTADMADIEWLMAEVTRQPSLEGVVDVEARVVRFGGRTIKAAIPDGARGQLIQGTWDATGVLLQAGDQIEQVGSRLPYVTGF